MPTVPDLGATARENSSHQDEGLAPDDRDDLSVHGHQRHHELQDVAWSVVCVKGDGAGSSSGQASSVTDFNRTIRHPYARPDNCIVAADAQLTNVGIHIRVWITYRK